MGKRISVLFLSLLLSLFASCQEKKVDYKPEEKIDYRNASNYNQSIDIMERYLEILNDDFLFGISVTKEIAIAWDDAINNYDSNWAIALENLYLPLLSNRNIFSSKPYALTGEEIIALIEMQSIIFPDIVDNFKELYSMFLHVSEMLNNPDGSFFSYVKDIKNTEQQFTELYKKTKDSIPNKVNIDIVKVSESSKSLNFWGITRGVSYDQTLEILKSKNIEISSKASIWDILPNEKSIELQDINYYGVDWCCIEIHFLDDVVSYMIFEISELDFKNYEVVTAVKDYHDVIKTTFFDNFYYEETEFADYNDYGINDFFKSKYKDIFGNTIELHRYGGSRMDSLYIFSDIKDEIWDKMFDDVE